VFFTHYSYSKKNIPLRNFDVSLLHVKYCGASCKINKTIQKNQFNITLPLLVKNFGKLLNFPSERPCHKLCLRSFSWGDNAWLWKA